MKGKVSMGDKIIKLQGANIDIDLTSSEQISWRQDKSME